MATIRPENGTPQRVAGKLPRRGTRCRGGLARPRIIVTSIRRSCAAYERSKMRAQIVPAAALALCMLCWSIVAPTPAPRGA